MSSPKADMAVQTPQNLGRPAVIPHQRELGLHPSLCSVTRHKLPWKGGAPGPGGCIKSDRGPLLPAWPYLEKKAFCEGDSGNTSSYLTHTSIDEEKNLPYNSTSLCHQENLIKANGGKLPEYDKKNLHKAHKKALYITAKLKTIPLKSRIIQRYPLSPLLFSLS